MQPPSLPSICSLLSFSSLITLCTLTNAATISSDVHTILSRGDCRAIQVVSGDGCPSLATRCKISGADFTKYNPAPNFCATLKPNQWVCCSAGSVPDKTPKPQSDGTCATYQIGEGDGCYDIANKFGITQQRIEDVNKKTWGWSGCGRLQRRQIICLSTGNTPMPSTIPGLTCGPQVPGTKKPSGKFTGDDLANLNPCPLNACCSGFGFCGTTLEFCNISVSDTGAPGSFKPNTNGCISNCGTKIVGNSNPPATFANIAYFEAFNIRRDCLTMDVDDLVDNKNGLTHVHFAFAGLTEKFNVTFDPDIEMQFAKFSSVDVPWKKIISFGGWAQSTDDATYQRYRDAVKPGNRETLVSNVMAFLDKHNLAGVDLDWEYPGATDIPGVPPGGSDEGDDYLQFVKLMNQTLVGKDKTLSIALPASYWYLKAFPLEKMAPYLSYFIYMTYHLHGQWDYGNKFANTGCDGGNCLRSHVNKTETENALSLITKAGVPAAKVMVGIASYGRSFGMKDPKCVDPTCQFTGNFTASTAEPGDCTDTAGYISNAEISVIGDSADQGIEGYSATRWHDLDSDSDIMVYGTQGSANTWVAYMGSDTKKRRIDWVKGLNFGGTTDWALDLQDWEIGPSDSGDGGLPKNWDLPSLECFSSTWPTTLEDLNNNMDSVPPECRSQAIVSLLIDQLEDAIAQYQIVSDGYDDKFGWYVKWVKDSIDTSLDDFMALGSGEGIHYMDCHWASRYTSGSGPCTDVDFKGPPSGLHGPREVDFTMRDEDGFYKALMDKYGIDKSWLQWKAEYGTLDPCICPGPGGTSCPECDQETYLYRNYPRRIDDTDKIDVPNPKSLIDKAIPDLNDLGDVMVQTYIQMRLGALDANATDAATAFSMPVFMLEDANTAIQNIKDIGEQEEKTRTKDLVLNILTIVFAVIPFVGEAVEALGGAAAIARAALIIGELGNAGLSIESIVADPTSAPFAILGMLVGAGGIAAKGPKKAFGDAADARNSMSPDKLKLFSSEFQRKDGLVQGIVKKCG